MMTSIVAADQFCGGGGTSTGLAQACQERAIVPRLYALNHNKIALETHKRNHPWAIHVSEEMERLNPLEVVTEGYLDLLVSSPECRFFSVAMGARPINDQLRALPFEVLKWVEALHPEAILVENVPEFMAWGPLLANDRPDPARKGLTFRKWTGRIRNLDYSFDYRILNAADYGAATSRRRFFLIALKGRGRPIVWPLPTHSARESPTPGLTTWRAAREVIDWSLPGTSLWERTRPLAFATWRRILIGLVRYGSQDIQPFVKGLMRQSGVDSRERGKPQKGAPQFIILPPLGFFARGGDANRPRSTEDPFHTLTRRGGGHLITPFITPVAGRRANKGIPVKSVEDPFTTITSRVGWWLTDAVIVPRHGERKGQSPRSHSVDRPMPVVPTDGGGILAQGVVVRYNSSGGQWSSVESPVPTVTTKDRLLLVRPEVIDGKYLDIRIRLFREHELAAAQGFPTDYSFAGNRGEIKRQIGNAVEVNIARALCASLLNPAEGPLDRYAAS